MRYRTNDIGDEGIDIDVPVTAAWLSERLAEVGAAPAAEGLVLRGRIERTGGSDDELLLRGTLRGALEMTCERCLEPTRVGLDVPVTVAFVERAPEGPVDGEVDPDDASGDFVVIKDGEIDLSEELREEILLALPMSPRCEPECKGICPHCGGNLDQKACDCAEKAKRAASPFAALEKLKS